MPPRYICAVPNCRRKCRSRNALTKHIRASHSKFPHAGSDAQAASGADLEPQNPSPSPSPSPVTARVHFCTFSGCIVSYPSGKGLRRHIRHFHSPHKSSLDTSSPDNSLSESSSQAEPESESTGTSSRPISPYPPPSDNAGPSDPLDDGVDADGGSPIRGDSGDSSMLGSHGGDHDSDPDHSSGSGYDDSNNYDSDYDNDYADHENDGASSPDSEPEVLPAPTKRTYHPYLNGWFCFYLENN